MKRTLPTLALMPLLAACSSEPSQADIERAFATRSVGNAVVDKHGCDKVSDRTYRCVITVQISGLTFNQTRTLMKTGSSWRLID
ncbi:MAG: hypothetical protein AAF636_21275 [Pseudomonadota bacterium]